MGAGAGAGAGADDAPTHKNNRQAAVAIAASTVPLPNGSNGEGNNHFGIFACSSRLLRSPGSRDRRPESGGDMPDPLTLSMTRWLTGLPWHAASHIEIACKQFWNWSYVSEIAPLTARPCRSPSPVYIPTRHPIHPVKAARVALALLHKQSYCQVSISAASNFVAFRLVVFPVSAPLYPFRSSDPLKLFSFSFRAGNTPLPYLHPHDFRLLVH